MRTTGTRITSFQDDFANYAHDELKSGSQDCTFILSSLRRTSRFLSSFISLTKDFHVMKENFFMRLKDEIWYQKQFKFKKLVKQIQFIQYHR